jgi:hypothetical protein
VVTLYIVGFDTQQFYVLRTKCIYVLKWVLKTAIISLYNINWLVFITETECVYCAARTGSLNVIYIILCLKEVKANMLPYLVTFSHLTFRHCAPLYRACIVDSFSFEQPRRLLKSALVTARNCNRVPSSSVASPTEPSCPLVFLVVSTRLERNLTL